MKAPLAHAKRWLDFVSHFNNASNSFLSCFLTEGFFSHKSGVRAITGAGPVS